MNTVVTGISLTFLPGALILLLWLRPHFFMSGLSHHNKTDIGQENSASSNALALAIITGVVAIISMLLLSNGVNLWINMAAIISVLAAAVGVVRLAGTHAVLYMFVALVLVAISSTQLAVVAGNIVAIAAGLGVAFLLARSIHTRSLPTYLIAFALLDIAIVMGGLPQGAINGISAGIGDWANNLPVFNHLSVGSTDFGVMDVAYAALISFIMIRSNASRQQVALTVIVYTGFQLITVILVFTQVGALPATVPGMLALLAYMYSQLSPQRQLTPAFS